MVIARGDLCWIDLGEVRGSKPAKRRLALVIQADPFNASRLATTLTAVVTSNTALAVQPHEFNRRGVTREADGVSVVRGARVPLGGLLGRNAMLDAVLLP